MHPRNLLILLTSLSLGLGIIGYHFSLPTSQPMAAPAELTWPALLTLVEAHRGLTFTVKPHLIPSNLAEIQHRYESSVLAQWPDASAATAIRALEALGFRWQPRDFRYSHALAGLAAEQAGGYYDEFSHDLLYDAAADTHSTEAKYKVLQLLAKVLLSQHDPRVSLSDWKHCLDDSAQAAAALVNGEAAEIATACALALPESSNPINPDDPNAPNQFAETPRFFKYLALFPAIYGRPYFTNRPPESPLPLSTSQVMHPATSKLPLTVGLPPEPADPPTTEATAGEYRILLLFQSQLIYEPAVTAATGWLGDRYRVTPSGEPAGDHLLWKSVWASPQDAQEFMAAITETLLATNAIVDQPEFHLPHGELTVDDARKCLRIRLLPDERTVIVIHTPSPAWAGKMLHEL